MLYKSTNNDAFFRIYASIPIKISLFSATLLVALLLSGCSLLNTVKFQLDAETSIYYELTESEIEFEKKEKIEKIVNTINYYSDNVIELTNDEKKFLFFLYVGDMNYKPTSVTVQSYNDGSNTIYKATYYSGDFDSYKRIYETSTKLFICNMESNCRQSSFEEKRDFRRTGNTDGESLSTFRIEIIYLGDLIYLARSPYHDAAARVATAQLHLLSPSLRKTSGKGSLDLRLSYFNEYCSPSLSNCQSIVTNRRTYQIDLVNQIIKYDDRDLQNDPPAFGLISRSFNSYFNIYNDNAIIDAFVVNGKFDNSRYNDIKRDFSGNKGIDNLTKYIFYQE